MIVAFGATSVDGPAYTDVVDLARHAPAWLDDTLSAYSTYGLALFAVLMAVGWWHARRRGAAASVAALAVPFAVVAAFGVDAALKLLVREDRPCRSLRVTTLEACPAPGDWSFPSNHAAVAAAAAVAGLAAVAMALSRVWVGAHYPHDVLAGIVVGAVAALLFMSALRGRLEAAALRLSATRLRPLLVTS
ncbi:phosphatase PAP2 family protein [Streptomyces asoensis]|uniref:Phosphatase PAP2 family protein n=1 Tax=Streptomyces asoensis TaxID=249586 RepID=A0ABQ3RY99_9ACTN|nr:phosphatase PAP2 family protein [Streptomyces asoensis]GGQ54934.1 phosphatase PAP2 family protein [Streptomyces asoensis]GHI60829.1 phosphatase PAP2 family protein [Streptomyces asoensis]